MSVGSCGASVLSPYPEWCTGLQSWDLSEPPRGRFPLEPVVSSDSPRSLWCRTCRGQGRHRGKETTNQLSGDCRHHPPPLHVHFLVHNESFSTEVCPWSEPRALWAGDWHLQRGQWGCPRCKCQDIYQDSLTWRWFYRLDKTHSAWRWNTSVRGHKSFDDLLDQRAASLSGWGWRTLPSTCGGWQSCGHLKDQRVPVRSRCSDPHYRIHVIGFRAKDWVCT